MPFFARQRRQSVPGVLHRLVERSVHADLPDDVENDVLALDPLPRPAGQHDPDRLGHLEPHLPGDHRRGQVGAADPGRECAQRAVGARVAVRPDHQIAGNDEPLVGQQDVLNSHPPHLEVVHDPVLAREVAHDPGLLGRGDVLVRSEVVRDERDPRPVEDLPDSQVPDRPDGDRTGDVVPEREVNPRQDQLPRSDRFLPRVPSEDLLRERHAHERVSRFRSFSSGDRAACAPAPRAVRRRCTPRRTERSSPGAPRPAGGRGI